MTKLATLAVLALLASTACSSTSPVPPDAERLALVLTDDWQATAGHLQVFERQGTSWAALTAPLDVMVGRSGMGWGDGLHPAQDGGPTKHEGDGRTPAGVFALGPTFGYPVIDITGHRHIALTDSIECIDDPTSPRYGQIVDTSEVARTWSSSERMRRVDVYSLGAVIEHNPAHRPGGGSCIFLAVRKPVPTPTSGCTALFADDLLQVLELLDERRHPVVVELPMAAYSSLKDDWRLP